MFSIPYKIDTKKRILETLLVGAYLLSENDVINLREVLRSAVPIYAFYLANTPSKKHLSELGNELINEPLEIREKDGGLERLFYNAIYFTGGLIFLNKFMPKTFDEYNINQNLLLNKDYLLENSKNILQSMHKLSVGIFSFFAIKDTTIKQVPETLKFIILKFKPFMQTIYYSATQNPKKFFKASQKLNPKDPAVLQNIASFAMSENYVEGMGYAIKYLYLTSKLKRFSFLGRMLFYNEIKFEKSSNIFKFNSVLPMDVNLNLKIKYAKEALEEIINNQTIKHSDEEKTQLLSSLGLFFDKYEPEYANKVWKEFSKVINPETFVDELEPAGGTKGTAKILASKQRKYSPLDFAVFFKLSKNKQAIEGEFYKTKFLQSKQIKTEKMIYLGDVKDKKILISTQSWQPNILEYIKKYKPSEKEILIIFQKIMNLTEKMQDVLGTGFTYEDKTFNFKKVDLKEKHLGENGLIFPDETIYKKGLTNDTLDIILQDTKLKPTTDSLIRNFLYGEDIEFIDNELSKLSQNAEPINTLFYEPSVTPINVRNTLMKPFMEESVDMQLALLYHRILSHMKGYLKVPNPDFTYVDEVLKNAHSFTKENIKNAKQPPLFNKLLEQYELFGKNLIPISSYLTSKN